MKNLVQLFFLCLFISLVFCSCPRATFGSGNFTDTKWVTANFSDDTTRKPNFTDTTHLYIRISSKNVMEGFSRATAFDPRGDYNQFVSVFNEFTSTPHNPYTDVKYLLFNGNGNVWRTLGKQDSLFNESNYTEPKNNLHHQFEAIAEEISAKYNKRKFYVIFSDGEATIRQHQNANAAYLSDIENGVKTMLKTHPNTCIGVISSLANFDGDYSYDEGASKHIHCRRYLYAFCFFDNSFLPEFQRFADRVSRQQKGNAFIFNPSIPFNLLDTKYIIYPLTNGAANKSDERKMAAFRFPKNIPDSIVLENHIDNFQHIGLPQLRYKVLYYRPDNKVKFLLNKDPEVLEEGACTLDYTTGKFTAALHLKKTADVEGGIYRIEIMPITVFPPTNYPLALKPKSRILQTIPLTK